MLFPLNLGRRLTQIATQVNGLPRRALAAGRLRARERVECRCHAIAELQGADAEEYLREDGDSFVSSDTGERWRLDYPVGEQARLTKA